MSLLTRTLQAPSHPETSGFLVRRRLVSIYHHSYFARTDPDFLSNNQLIATGEAATLPLFSAADFDGWVNSFREALEQSISSDFDIQDVTSMVDGIRSGVGVGIVPSLLQVSTLTAQLNVCC